MVGTLAKILLSMFLVGAATMVQRRYGHRASGFLVGLPITTAPYLLLVAFEHGREFTIHSAQGVLQGQIALVLFLIAYGRAPERWPWWLTLSSATGLCLLVTIYISQFLFPPLATFAALALLWLVATKTWPSVSTQTSPVQHASWELPARLVVTLTILVGLTGIAPTLGATLAGGFATLPIISIVLCGATHRQFGPTGPRQFLRGLLISLPGSSSFSLTVALLAPQLSLYASLGVAAGVTLAVASWQGITSKQNRRRNLPA